MTVLVFILVLVALILVHELGHFVVAKWAGMRVDEFGIGYPPRALTIGKIGETKYTLNWIPFGGFVKIYGEDSQGDALAQTSQGVALRAFSARPRILQALVLVAGIAMNLLFAWVIFTGLLMVPHWIDDTTIAAPLPLFTALAHSAVITWHATSATASGLADFFISLFTFSANLSQVSGPIGIATAVGSASASGWVNLLSLVAIISINLALINLLPIPALDGGRLLFVIIEGIIRRPIKAVVAHTANAVGFVALILLMLVVTLHDIYKMVG